jgi:hypothetical protein
LDIVAHLEVFDMSDVMKGVGLAHTLAEAFGNSEAQFGRARHWSDTYINELTTKDGKERVLGPMLDVLRGDAEIVPVKRVIDTHLVKPGDADNTRDNGSVVVLNRLTRLPRRLTLGEFTVGVASRVLTHFYEQNQDEVARGRCKPKPETHIDVPDDDRLLGMSKRHLLPRYLIGKELPGIALRNFYVENPHHIPEWFPDIVLFWGTICKNNHCYYVPGIKRNGSVHGVRICSYEVVDGKDVLDDMGTHSGTTYDAAVFI